MRCVPQGALVRETFDSAFIRSPPWSIHAVARIAYEAEGPQCGPYKAGEIRAQSVAARLRGRDTSRAGRNNHAHRASGRGSRLPRCASAEIDRRAILATGQGPRSTGVIRAAASG